MRIKRILESDLNLNLNLNLRNPGEWDQLASWAVTNNVYSDHVRWLIQVPRLYDIYRTKGGVKTFQDILGLLL